MPSLVHKPEMTPRASEEIPVLALAGRQVEGKEPGGQR